jgi:hypothetical protein
MPYGMKVGANAASCTSAFSSLAVTAGVGRTHLFRAPRTATDATFLRIMGQEVPISWTFCRE